MDLPPGTWLWEDGKDVIIRSEPVARRWFELWKIGQRETAYYRREVGDGEVRFTRNRELCLHVIDLPPKAKMNVDTLENFP